MNGKDREIFEAITGRLNDMVHRLDDMGENIRVLNESHTDTQVRLKGIETQLETLSKVLAVGISLATVILGAIQFIWPR